jgi:hypothetical protein
MRTHGAKREIYPGFTESTLRFYRNQNWPFSVTSRPEQTRPTAVIVWGTAEGWNVHTIAEHKRRRWSEREEERRQRRQQQTMNDPSRRRSERRHRRI